MMRYRRFLIFLLLPLAVASFNAQAQYRWPTLQFEAFAGDPHESEEGSDDWLETEYLTGGVSNAIKQDIEHAMHEAAVWYQEHGFPPPVLDDQVETDNGLAYRVYVCSRDRPHCNPNVVPEKAPEAAYIPDCPQTAGRSKYIVIIAEKALDASGNLTELGYQTLAHELFHAIWPNTVAGRSDPDCEVGLWVSEGIADAVGWDIAEELWMNRQYLSSTNDGAIGKRWGYRPYFHRLPTNGLVGMPGQGGNKVDAGYQSSSFWRFLADAYPRGWNIMVSAGRPGPSGLLDLPLKDGPGWRSEVKWIDQGLRGKFNKGLNAMYAAFVAHFSYSSAPFSGYQGKQPGDKFVMDHWTNLLFEACATVDLSAAPQQKVRLNLKGLGARCIWVEPTGRIGSIQVTFQVGHDDPELLDDIWISMPGTTILVRASSVGHQPHGPTRYIATWEDFPQDGMKRQLYLVTNLAKEPDRSKTREFDLEVSIPSFTNSFTGPLPPRRHVPTPGQPSHKKHARKLSKLQSETQEMLVEQMQEDKKSLSGDTSNGTRIRPDPDRHECRNPFKYSACGPQMHISLSILPGTYLLPGQVSSTGGMMAQFMGAGLAQGQTMLSDSHEEAREVYARMDAIDGSKVEIATPFFDYGYSGTFESAWIRVKMRGDKYLSAFGPPDHTKQMPLTGMVTIEEYTPFIIRGSFVGPLAEMIDVPGSNPVYQPRETISGTFTSVAPWQADARVQLVKDSFDVEFDETMNMIGIPAGSLWKLKQDGLIPGSNAAPAPDAGAGGDNSGSGECTCECETKSFVDELCELLCEEEFAVCEDL